MFKEISLETTKHTTQTEDERGKKKKKKKILYGTKLTFRGNEGWNRPSYLAKAQRDDDDSVQVFVQVPVP